MSRPNLDTTKPTCAPLNIFERKGRYNAFNVKGTLGQVKSRLNRTRPNLNTKSYMCPERVPCRSFSIYFWPFWNQANKKGICDEAILRLTRFIQSKPNRRSTLETAAPLPTFMWLFRCRSWTEWKRHWLHWAEVDDEENLLPLSEKYSYKFKTNTNTITNTGLDEEEESASLGDTGWISGTLQWWFRPTGGNGWVRLPSSHY